MASKTVRNTIANESSEPKRRSKPIIRSNLEQTIIEVKLPKSSKTKLQNKQDEDVIIPKYTIKEPVTTINTQILEQVSKIEADKINKKKLKPTFAMLHKYINLNNFINYLKSFNELIGVFVDGISSSNYKFEASLYVDILKNFFKSSKMFAFFKKDEYTFKYTVTVQELIEYLISTPDDATLGKHDEIFLCNMMLFNCTFDINKLPDYDTLINEKKIEPYHNYIEPREETQVLAYFKYRILNEPFFTFKSSDDINAKPYFKDCFKFVNQYRINDADGIKIYDLAIAIKNFNTNKYDVKLLLEVQEAKGGHVNNPEDDKKKLIAINNDVDIMYYRLYHYYHNPDTLKATYNRYFNFVKALILESNVECRKEYLKFKYTQSYRADKVVLENEKLTCKNKTRLTEIRDQLQIIQDKLDSEKILLQILKWKDDSRNVTLNNNNDHIDIDITDENYDLEHDCDPLNDKTNKVINLDEVIEILKSRIKNIKQNIINEYNNKIKYDDNKHHIDWDLLAEIIMIYSKTEIRQTLLSYLLKVEVIYEDILKLDKKYQTFNKNLIRWSHSYKSNDKNDKHNKELAIQKDNTARTTSLNNYLIEKINDFSLVSTQFYEAMEKNMSFEVSNDVFTIYDNYSIKLKEFNNLNFNMEANVTNKYKIDHKNYVFGSTDGEFIFVNRPDLDIKYKKTKYIAIKYGTFLAICIANGVPSNICYEYVSKYLLRNVVINDGMNIPNLEINDELLNINKPKTVIKQEVKQDTKVVLNTNINIIKKIDNIKNNKLDDEKSNDEESTDEESNDEKIVGNELNNSNEPDDITGSDSEVDTEMN